MIDAGTIRISYLLVDDYIQPEASNGDQNRGTCNKIHDYHDDLE
jgi:hypothetical protein